MKVQIPIAWDLINMIWGNCGFLCIVLNRWAKQSNTIKIAHQERLVVWGNWILFRCDIFQSLVFLFVCYPLGDGPMIWVHSNMKWGNWKLHWMCLTKIIFKRLARPRSSLCCHTGSLNSGKINNLSSHKLSIRKMNNLNVEILITFTLSFYHVTKTKYAYLPRCSYRSCLCTHLRFLYVNFTYPSSIFSNWEKWMHCQKRHKHNFNFPTHRVPHTAWWLLCNARVWF